jgi:uncharacterized protein (TIGR00297 family)
VPLRLLAGALVAAAIALLAHRAGSLAGSGAAAAVAVGTAAVAAGWSWGALLIAVFVASSALSRWRREAKAERTASVVEKGGPRDAWQVLANGGVFAGAAIASVLAPGRLWSAIAIGAIAASTADTWGTEVGSAIGGTPRSLLSGRPVAAGASGGVTVAGSVATLAGAGFVAARVMLLGLGAPVALAAVAGGVAGALADSLLGAMVQERRHCPACELPTERLVHGCGSTTRVAGGVAGFRNDAVNLAASAVGAAVGAVAALAAGA